MADLFGLFPKPVYALASCFVLIAFVAIIQIATTSLKPIDAAQTGDYFMAVFEDDYIYEAFDISAL